jgi:hypothetical protein
LQHNCRHANGRMGFVRFWDLGRYLLNAQFSAAQLKRAEFDNNLVFVFTAQTEANFIGDLYVSLPVHQCMGGGGGYPTAPSAELHIYSALCRPDLPPGPLDVQIGGADLFGAWDVTWQP